MEKDLYETLAKAADLIQITTSKTQAEGSLISCATLTLQSVLSKPVPGDSEYILFGQWLLAFKGDYKPLPTLPLERCNKFTYTVRELRPQIRQHMCWPVQNLDIIYLLCFKGGECGDSEGKLGLTHSKLAP